MTYLVGDLFSPSLRGFSSLNCNYALDRQQYLLAPQSDDDSELPTERLHSPDLPDLQKKPVAIARRSTSDQASPLRVDLKNRLAPR